jgi:acyl-CoA synthetase (AMP-forming)/AMP-acid ligase II
MLGLMQDRPLMISAIIAHAARSHGQAEVVSRTLEGDIHRTTYSAIERRARRLARVLQQLGVRPADRVATLAWNGYRHLELYYAISGMQAVCHTINPRLSHDDVAYIATHAEDRVIFVEACFIGLIEAIAPRLPALHAVVVMTDRALMPTLALPAAMRSS